MVQKMRHANNSTRQKSSGKRHRCLQGKQDWQNVRRYSTQPKFRTSSRVEKTNSCEMKRGTTFQIQSTGRSRRDGNEVGATFEGEDATGETRMSQDRDQDRQVTTNIVITTTKRLSRRQTFYYFVCQERFV
jgi:hypothetical protein